MTVMQKVLTISKDVPFFYLEDVYVSLCIRRHGYTLVSLEGFNVVRVPLDSCVYKQIVTSHGLSPDDMFYIYTLDCLDMKT